MGVRVNTCLTVDMNASTRTKKTKPQQSAQDVFPRKRIRTEPFARQIGAVAKPGAPEAKNLDQAMALAAVGAAYQWSALTLLNSIPQGNTAVTRIGRRVTITKLVIRWRFGGPYCRFTVIYDHAPNGALPAITDIFVINDINGVNNLINNDRFMILHDEYIVSANGQSSSADSMAGKWVYKGPPLQNQWTNAATGTIADITTGAIYVAVATTSTASVWTAYARVRYTDQ